MAGEDSDQVKAVKAALAELHPDPLPPAHVEALRRPLDLSDDKRPVAPPPKEPPQMSEGSAYNGQYRALQTDVDNLKTNFHDLRTDIDARFSSLQSDMREMQRDFGARFDKLLEAQGTSKPDVYRSFGVLAGTAAVLLTVVGAFASLAKTNLDTNIQFTNEKIGTQAGIVRDDFSATNAAISDVAAAVKNVVATTIPRPELEYRINGNRDAIRDIEKQQDHHSTQIAGVIADASNLKADVERLKGDIVTRRENEGHWEDLSNRVNLLSNRITEAIKAAGGGDIGDQLKQLRDQVNDFQRKFIAVPAFPKYNDK